jgi:putative membrane protein
MTPDILPLEVHGPHGFDGGSAAMPFLSGFLVLLFLAAAFTAFYLWRQGKLTLPGFAPRRAPEDEAKRILAERFARGDIDSDDFMERSSILNWTPGSETLAARPRKKRR